MQKFLLREPKSNETKMLHLNFLCFSLFSFSFDSFCYQNFLVDNRSKLSSKINTISEKKLNFFEIMQCLSDFCLFNFIKVLPDIYIMYFEAYCVYNDFFYIILFFKKYIKFWKIIFKTNLWVFIKFMFNILPYVIRLIYI